MVEPKLELTMKITVQATVNASLASAWAAWNDPQAITKWNAADDSWHTTKAAVDLREGGKFSARMEAKDGSAGFDFEGVYTRVEPRRAIEYAMADGRQVSVTFTEQEGGVLVTETFDAEAVNPPEFQKQGWQAILDNYARYTAALS
jgi:uncharacterized protein YndB with AHSA1/START domain